jgi:RNase P/RNase MRP subunit p29
VLETADDSPFILKPAAPPEPALKVLPPTAPSLMPFGSIFRRKAKMTEVARIVLPPKRDESQPLPVPSEPSPTVVPPAFPVVAMTARVNQPAVQEKIHASPAAPVEKAAPEKSVAEEKILGAVRGDNAPGEVALPGKPEAPSPGKTPGAESQPEKPDGSKTEPASIPTPLAETKPAASPGDLSDAPKVDPEAHKPEPSAAPVPKADPEAPKVASKPAAELSVPPATPEKREFHLANGERVAGVVLSETPEAVYIEHGTLGVLTIPRANIAKRLVEIILINGDRIVGDIMAETADTLYVRHASLGMLTVPRAQRSTRVVEAILKDGDRILGEVLTETDTFTVIRSATLGTITVPHGKMAMLNRKIEQIEMKALPPPAAEIKESRPSA